MAAKTDVLLIGAGASGLMCALTAAKRGRSVILLDHSEKLAEKIRISGGGQCNFTNLYVRPDNYLSHNPHFCRSALSRFTPSHFIEMMNKHGIRFHEKTQGQLFCDDGSEAIISMLKKECDDAGVRFLTPCIITNIIKQEAFKLTTSFGMIHTESLVIATGGLSVPKTGATPMGYKIAQQFSIPVTHLKPGLVPLSFQPVIWAPYAELAGISFEVMLRCGQHCFKENMLFTHRGLSGPGILQISSYWESGQNLSIDLLPTFNLREHLAHLRSSNLLPSNYLAQHLPGRFATVWCRQLGMTKPLKQYSEKERVAFANHLHDWQITPSGTLGYNKAEVTCGGIDTHVLSSKTMESNQVPGLYFIGEVVDVTGQLGGFNLHWAWASGYAAGLAV